MTKPRESDNDNTPQQKPDGPRKPYPVDDPGIGKPPDIGPDCIPGNAPESLPKM